VKPLPASLGSNHEVNIPTGTTNIMTLFTLRQLAVRKNIMTNKYLQPGPLQTMNYRLSQHARE
jgi:hypothetical protein